MDGVGRLQAEAARSLLWTEYETRENCSMNRRGKQFLKPYTLEITLLCMGSTLGMGRSMGMGSTMG